MRDPYEVLNVSREAGEADIKAAFRRQAVKHHPDRNPDDPDAQKRFSELNEAYQILSDPQKRAAYDRHGAAAFQPGGMPGPGPGSMDLGNLDGIFGDILGAFGFRTTDRGDVRQRIRVSFEEAALGCDEELTYQHLDVCDRCGGERGEPETKISTCSACGGRGRVRFQQGFFPLAVERPCSRCSGSGRIPSQRCSSCAGKGLVPKSRTIELTIPPGVDTGASRVVERGGNRLSPASPPGDLEVVVEVQPHPFFQRSGNDIVCEVPISFVQATLGGEVEVPTLEGKVKLRIPPATQPGRVLRIRGKGVPHRLRASRGDQLVEITVEVPTRLSERARELVEELGQELGEDVQPQQHSFVDKLKGFFG